MQDAHIEELEKSLKIELENLDVEIQQQALIFYRVAKEYTLASADRDAAKDMMNQTRSEAELEIRDQLSKSGEKATEGKISAMVDVDEDFCLSQENFRKMQARASMLGDLKQAWEQRGKMLSDLARLYCADWYSDQATHVKSMN